MRLKSTIVYIKVLREARLNTRSELERVVRLRRKRERERETHPEMVLEPPLARSNENESLHDGCVAVSMMSRTRRIRSARQLVCFS